MQVENADLEMWEHHIESKIESDRQLPETEREALIVARRGQGLFKQRVMEIETRCRITGVTNPSFVMEAQSRDLKGRGILGGFSVEDMTHLA